MYTTDPQQGLFYTQKTKEKIDDMNYKNLSKRMFYLEEKIWMLENPPKFKHGDKVLYLIYWDHDLHFAIANKNIAPKHVTVLYEVEKEHPSKSREYSIDDGERIIEVNEYDLRTESEFNELKKKIHEEFNM